MGDSDPNPPKFENFGFFDFIRRVSLIRFQEALNGPSNIIFTHFMPRNVILGTNLQNGEKWGIRTQTPPKFEKFGLF